MKLCVERYAPLAAAADWVRSNGLAGHSAVVWSNDAWPYLLSDLPLMLPTPPIYNDMTLLGGAMGGQERSIALAHALRILTVVMTIPVWYRLVNGAQTSVLAMVHGPTGNDWKDYAVLIGCGVAGAAIGRVLRLPAAFMMGPMILSAIAHLGGATLDDEENYLIKKLFTGGLGMVCISNQARI